MSLLTSNKETLAPYHKSSCCYRTTYDTSLVGPVWSNRMDTNLGGRSTDQEWPLWLSPFSRCGHRGLTLRRRHALKSCDDHFYDVMCGNMATRASCWHTWYYLGHCLCSIYVYVASLVLRSPGMFASLSLNAKWFCHTILWWFCMVYIPISANDTYVKVFHKYRYTYRRPCNCKDKYTADTCLQ